MKTLSLALGLVVAGVMPVAADDTLAVMQQVLQDVQPMMEEGFSEESVDTYLEKECNNGNQTGCNQLMMRQLSKQFSQQDEVAEEAAPE